jgi:hypothetical protein
MKRAVLGGLLMAAGALTLAFLVFISNSAGAERLMMSLGLAGSAMLSATAQGMIFVGAWLVWKARRRGTR